MSDFSNIKAVLFDMDGTLIKHTWQYSQITDALFEKFASALSPLTCDEFYEVFWDKNVDMWYMMLDGVIDGETAQIYSYTNTLRALKKDPALGAEMAAYWLHLVLEEAVPFDETHTVLERVGAHFTTGIVTNGFTITQRAKIKRYGLAELVDFCLISEEVGFHKPDARIFEQALERAGNISPEQAVFVGDNLEADILGALEAGLQPVFIDLSDEQSPPDEVVKINQLTELLALLERRKN